MIWKILRVLLIIVVVILVWNSELIASSQQQAPEGQESTLIAAATLGATLGAFSVGFFEYTSAWFRYCNYSWDRASSTQEFVNFVLQYIRRYTWEKHLNILLGPAIGATAGVIAVSQMKGIEGNKAMALVAGSFNGVLGGLGFGCFLVRVAPNPSDLAVFEMLSTTTTIVLAALAAVDSYEAAQNPARSRSSSRASHQPTSSGLTMSFPLWSLRF
jgi:hypothetical protein